MRGMKRLTLLTIGLTALALCLGASQAMAAGTTVLWGKQTAGWGATNAKTEGNDVTVKKSATILKVEGSASSYCIWKKGGTRGYLCGGSTKSIIGRTLPPGTYVVLPGLKQGQRSSRVSITLQLK